MKTRTVTETHYIESDPCNPLIPMTVMVKYTMLDDGFVTVEYIEGTIDYNCVNKRPI